MKNEILDDIFNDKLRNELKEGEVVTWERQPRFSNYSQLVVVGFILVFYGINLFNAIVDRTYWAILIWVLLAISSLVSIFFSKKKTRYLITNQRIIFQLPAKMLKSKIQSLPLNQLVAVIVKEKVNNNGTLELVLKKTFEHQIKTIDVRNGYLRKNPTLELIDDVEDIQKYIEDNSNISSINKQMEQYEKRNSRRHIQR